MAEDRKQLIERLRILSMRDPDDERCQAADLLERDAAVLEGLTQVRGFAVSRRDELNDATWHRDYNVPATPQQRDIIAEARAFGSVVNYMDADPTIKAALQHAQEQVGENEPQCEDGTIPTDDPSLIQAGVTREPCPGCPRCRSEQVGEGND